MITGAQRVIARISKGGGLSGSHIEGGVRTSFSGVYLPVDGEAIGFSRQGSNVGEVSFTP